MNLLLNSSETFVVRFLIQWFHFNAGSSDAHGLSLINFGGQFGSVLSQYGVHSFPVLFMHNRTARVRYYGPRQLESLILFYQNYTGTYFMALTPFFFFLC